MIVHLNGQLLPREHAHISVLDRGFVFGEGVYEGLRAIAWPLAGQQRSRIVGIDRHIRRLQEGLASAGISWDASRLHEMSTDLVAANELHDAFVYWQITGGAPGPFDAPRTRVPPKGLSPTVFGYASAVPGLETLTGPATKRVIACQDVRWELGELKSISLMGNVWIARRAAQGGCDEAILLRGSARGGVVSEGLATNLVIAFPRTPHPPKAQGLAGYEIVTPALGSAPMLRGVTRDILLDLAPEIGERTIYADELSAASEIMMVGTTTYVTTISHVNDQHVGPKSDSDSRPGTGFPPGSTPGPVAQELFRRLIHAYRTGQH